MFTETFEKDLLKGVVTLKTQGKRLSEKNWGEEVLYRPYQGKAYEKQELTFIPYYAWTNRGVGEMTVWVRI